LNTDHSLGLKAESELFPRMRGDRVGV